MLLPSAFLLTVSSIKSVYRLKPRNRSLAEPLQTPMMSPLVHLVDHGLVLLAEIIPLAWQQMVQPPTMTRRLITDIPLRFFLPWNLIR